MKTLEKDKIESTIVGLGVTTDVKELIQQLKIAFNGTHIASRGGIVVAISNASYWWTGASVGMEEWFEDCDNSRFVGGKILPKLISRGIIKKRKCQRYELLVSLDQLLNL